MTLFEQILSEVNLLLEKKNEVSVEKIKDAIENRKIVSIMYNDQQGGGGKSWRYIYPVVYGELKDRKTGTGTGKMAIRAFQPQGSSKRGKPAWKLFRLDRIVAWYNQENTETDQSHTFSKEELGPLLNTNGDKHLIPVYWAPYINVEYLIDSEPVSKSDIQSEPGKEETANNVRYTYNTDWKNQYNKEEENGISLDNNGNVTYNSEKVPSKIVAPETKPITDTDVQSTERTPDNQVNNEKLTADEKPITKDEIEPENDMVNTYKDLMNRWKNNEEEEDNNSYV